MVYDILPTQNLKYDDVRDTLASSGGSVNNNMSSLFQNTANINKWSKYKPVTLSEDFPTSDTWYAGDDGKCGLVLNESVIDIDKDYQQSAFESIRASYNDTTQWTYAGIINNKYRLGDFRGYTKKAICPFVTFYAKGQVNKIPYNSSQIITEYEMFSLDLEGGDRLPENNLRISDFEYKYYDGAYNYLKDAKLGVIILIGSSDPFDTSTSWNSSFTNPYGCIFLADKTLNEAKSDEKTTVSIPYSYFATITNYMGNTYTVIGGLFFGSDYSRFIPLPFDDEHYPVIKWTFESKPVNSFRAECTGWSQYPTYSEWNTPKWIYTEDMIAIRPISSSNLQLKFTMYTTLDNEQLVLSSQTVYAKYSDQDGVSKTSSCSVTDENFSGNSITISNNSNNPTENVVINLTDVNDAKNEEGFEFHIDIFYKNVSTNTEIKIAGYDFRYTSDYKN